MSRHPDPLPLAAAEVTVRHGRTRALAGVTLRVDAGEKVALLGPNGSGKTTLLRVLAGIVEPDEGRALLDGRDLREFSDRERAQRLAFVAQEEHTDLPFTGEEVLLLARSAGSGAWRPSRRVDHDAVQALATELGLGGLLGRELQAMSGGERRRVLLARAFAQGSGTLLFDEPTNHLDLKHQHDLLARLRAAPHTVVVALHDLDLAAAYCSRVVLLAKGAVVADGSPAEVLTAEQVQRVYKVRAERADVGARVRLVIGGGGPVPGRLPVS